MNKIVISALLSSLLMGSVYAYDMNSDIIVKDYKKGPGYGNGSSSNDSGYIGEAKDYNDIVNSYPVANLTPEQKEGLVYMYQEEKMARDVYKVLGDKWGLQIFNNIANAEQTHMNAVKALLDKYSIPVPVSDEIGDFVDPNIKALYESLIAKGEQSQEDALQVGIDIENTDIADLEERMVGAPDDIKAIYEKLKEGSERHLNAFTRNLNGDTSGEGQGGHANGSGGSIGEVQNYNDIVNSYPVADLTPEQKEGLVYMYQEEKMARDVYTLLGNKWGLNIFSNIANAEQTHMNAVKALLDKYSIPVPVGDEVGTFNDSAIQSLYDSLMARGMESQEEALKVGIDIEKTDIADLEERMVNAPDDIKAIYEKLKEGSEKHLDAFTKVLNGDMGGEGQGGGQGQGGQGNDQNASGGDKQGGGQNGESSDHGKKPKTDPTKAKSYIENLYKHAFGREPDPSGSEYWMQKIMNGEVSATDVAKDIFHSEELQQKDLSDEEYVTMAYEILLGREPDQEGLEYWVNQLQNEGLTRELLFYEFAFSNEFDQMAVEEYTIPPYDQEDELTAFLERMYAYVLGRDADPAGVNYWSNLLKSDEVTASELVHKFFNSEEMKNKNLSDEEFVKTAYKAVFGRNPDKGGLEYWVGQLQNGMTRDEVLDQFLASEEFDNLTKKYGIKK